MPGDYFSVCIEEVPFEEGMAEYDLVRNDNGEVLSAVRFWMRWGCDKPIGNLDLRGHHPKSFVPGLLAHLGMVIQDELHRDPHAVGRDWRAVFQRDEWPDHIKDLPFEILWDVHAAGTAA